MKNQMLNTMRNQVFKFIETQNLPAPTDTRSTAPKISHNKDNCRRFTKLYCTVVIPLIIHFLSPSIRCECSKKGDDKLYGFVCYITQDSRLHGTHATINVPAVCYSMCTMISCVLSCTLQDAR